MDSCRNSIKAMFDQVYSFRYMFMVASFVCVVVHLLDLSAFSCHAGGNIDADRLLLCVCVRMVCVFAIHNITMIIGVFMLHCAGTYPCQTPKCSCLLSDSKM